jgi:carbamate kinase
MSDQNSTRTIVVALGGNAITREYEEGNIYQQFANTRRALIGIMELVRQGCRLAITHGNGPQVGQELIRVEQAEHLVPSVPLGVIVADLEGGMGYMIGQSLQNSLHLEGIRRDVVTLLSQVVVDRDDPSILNPTKFVGPFYNQDMAEHLRQMRGYQLREDANRGFRRVVPSPYPRSIVEAAVIRRLIAEGVIVITAGGGGIPVYYEPDGRLEGVDAVIDKDLASAILALDIGAEELYILTAVDQVAINYGKPTQQFFATLTLDQARQYHRLGHFPPGSMGPKIEAAILFLERGGQRVTICSVEKMAQAIQGRSGTQIILR